MEYTGLVWCSDLTFSKFLDGDSSSSTPMPMVMAYAGRCVDLYLSGSQLSIADYLTTGALTSAYASVAGFAYTAVISSIFVEQLNLFEVQFHFNGWNGVTRCWDGGYSTMPTIASKFHDDGNISLNLNNDVYEAYNQPWTLLESIFFCVYRRCRKSNQYDHRRGHS